MGRNKLAQQEEKIEEGRCGGCSPWAWPSRWEEGGLALACGWAGSVKMEGVNAGTASSSSAQRSRGAAAAEVRLCSKQSERRPATEDSGGVARLSKPGTAAAWTRQERDPDRGPTLVNNEGSGRPRRSEGGPRRCGGGLEAQARRQGLALEGRLGELRQ